MQLLARGFTVNGVEPNDDMRIVAEQTLKADSRFISVKATAENTTSNDNSLDLITVAQAFHWFDIEQFRLECQRILKQDGKVALVWNSRDGSSEINKESAEAPIETDKEYKPFIHALSKLFEKYSNNGKIVIPNITRSYLGKV